MLGIAACTSPGNVGPDPVQDRDIEVYAAVLDSLFIGPSRTIEQLVVRDSTVARRREQLVAGVIEALYNVPGADSSAVVDFEERTRDAHSLDALRHVPLRVPVVLPDEDFMRLLPERNAELFWQQFYARYPGSPGIIALSAIGYNRQGDRAVLMVDHGCGGLCGTGRLVALRREAGRWRVMGVRITWVS